MPGWELIGEEEKEAVLAIFRDSNGIVFEHGFDVLRNGRFRVREFEKKFGEKLGYDFVQAVSSGTAGLLVALKALGVKQGDEVITQTFTFIATIEAIIECGATPVIVDVDESLNMDPQKLDDAITDKTRAILPVHMLGAPAEMDAIMDVAKIHNLHVLEDACELLGGSYNGKPIGNIGNVGVFSLDGGKTITCGEGGLIVTDDEETYRFCREYVDHGHLHYAGLPKGRDKARFTGFNYRITEMHAAYASAQLDKLDQILHANLHNFEELTTRLTRNGAKFRKINDEKGDIRDTVVLTMEDSAARNRIVNILTEENLPTKIIPDACDWHFVPNMPQFLNTHPEYRSDHWTRWKQSRETLGRCVAIPISVKMPPELIERYEKAIQRAS